jgi:hypothetical protein
VGKNAGCMLSVAQVLGCAVSGSSFTILLNVIIYWLLSRRYFSFSADASYENMLVLTPLIISVFTHFILNTF